MIRPFALLAGLMLLVSCSSAETASNVHLTPGPPQSQELFDEIASNDSALFEAVFDKCDFDRVGDLITDDFEFYHDKWGQIATSKEQFVESIRNLCERQKQGIDFRSRRELVKGSLAVYPLNNYGAVEVGVHRFYAISEGKEDKLTETARFTHVWKKDNGRWRVARVVSYDHKLN
jgi:ketosteroid isomerase-like protein